jgi:proteasome lid subunit RPN8/RPN11
MTSTSTSSKTAVSPPAEPTRPEISQLGRKQPPDLTEVAHLHGREPGPAQVRVIVGQAALQQIDSHGRSNLYSELGGALLGRAYQFQERLYVEIQAALPVASADHGPVHFTFNADSWRQLSRDREQHYPNLEIVGWFHTHPNLGVFYSADDVVVHSAAFTLPWQVGLVVDPAREEACFFGWEGGELAPLPGFYELLDSQQTPFARWRVVRTSVWQTTSEAELAGRAPSGAPQPTVYAPRAAQSSFNPGIGLIVGSLGLLLSFFLLVGWVVPLTQEVRRLESVVLAMADEALAESNAAACPDARLRILSPLAGQRFLVGSRLEVLGTASFPEAARYQLATRPLSAESWTPLRTSYRDASFGRLARWDTTEFAPGAYVLRLTAVDRNNIRLANSPICEVQIELLP